MARLMLTVLAVKKAEPREKGYKLADAKGLHLFVTTTGTKSWRFKYRFDGKEKRLTFGLFPEVTITQAREKRDEARRLLQQGRDPAVDAEERKQANFRAAGATFAVVARAWLADHEPYWSAANAIRVRNRIERDMLRTLGKLPVREIDSSMVLAQLRKIEARGSIETAKRVRGYVRAILKRAKGEGLISGDVIEDIDDLADALRPTPPPVRLPALTSEAQLITFQQTIDQSSAHILTKLASRFIALTVVRVSTLRLANWTEFQGIDWTDAEVTSEVAVWNMPAAHMKLEVGEKHNAELNHDIPLSRQAVETLRAIHQITGQFNLVFPRETDWNKPMTDTTLARLYQRVAVGRYKDRMVPHGWRTPFLRS